MPRTRLIPLLGSGTKTITENGTHDVGGYAHAIVNVPTSEGGGGITPTGSVTLTENGTYDVTEKATAIVSVPAQETGTRVTWAEFRSMMSAGTYDENELYSVTDE